MNTTNPFSKLMLVSTLSVVLCLAPITKLLSVEAVQTIFKGHEYVDLGLPSGTMWATMNLGAVVVSDSGSCYAWGELIPKDTFTQSNYQYYQNGGYVNIGSDISGTQYDAASYQWGTGWQMPTKTQCQELINNTTRSIMFINGKSCMVVESNINGNSIIVPGVIDEGGTASRGYICYGYCFWTSTANNSATAYRQWEWSAISYGMRYQWYPIRPVVNSSFLASQLTTVVANVNDTTMGTVSGGGEYYSGDTVTLIATPLSGCQFSHWNDGVTDNPRYVTVTADTTFTAYFTSGTGVEGISESSNEIYSCNGQIVILGAENATVRIFDMMGRLVCTTNATSNTQSIPVNASGVYMVQVDSKPAQRVVLIR